jgi:adenylate kinase family enzyme
MIDSKNIKLLPGQRFGILIIGPTGSGKTPLGHTLANGNYFPFPAIHFDFGEEMRQISQFDVPTGPFTPADIQLIQTILKNNALLTNEQFYLAEKTLDYFIERHQLQYNHLIIFNGLPRHPNQAIALQPRIRMKALIILECSLETIIERIRQNSGGDRTHRTDDSLPEIRRKLDWFHQQTKPLLTHYEQDQPQFFVPIYPDTPPEDIIRRLNIAHFFSRF